MVEILGPPSQPLHRLRPVSLFRSPQLRNLQFHQPHLAQDSLTLVSVPRPLEASLLGCTALDRETPSPPPRCSLEACTAPCHGRIPSSGSQPGLHSLSPLLEASPRALPFILVLGGTLFMALISSRAPLPRSCLCLLTSRGYQRLLLFYRKPRTSLASDTASAPLR